MKAKETKKKFAFKKAKKKAKPKVRIEDMDLTKLTISELEGLMTQKQLFFCKEYLIDKNATKAAERSKYSKKTAQRMGSENLSKPLIKEYLKRLLSKQSKRIEITADRVLQEIAKLAFLDPKELFDEKGNLIPIIELPKDVAAAISSIEIKSQGDGGVRDDDEEALSPDNIHKIKLWSKKDALEMLAKHYKLLTDRFDIGGQDDNPVRTVDVTNMSAQEVAALLNQELSK